MLFWAVLSISMITILGSTAVSPALAGIKQAFPMYSDATIQLVLIIPPLFIIPSCLLCNSAVKKWGKKKVLIVGILLYLLGGVSAGAMPGFGQMLAARAALGIACGFITPLAQAFISSYFEGELRRKMTGYSASASYLMGIIASFTVGQLASINWRLAFLIYLVALVVLILNWKYLPDDAGDKIEKKTSNFAGSKRWNGKGIMTAVAMGMINVAFYTFTASISLFMFSEKIGDTSASGMVVAVFMLSGFFVGLVTELVRKITGRYAMAIACIMMGSGYFILSGTWDIVPLFMGAALIGGSYSIFYSGIFLAIGECSASKEENTRLVTYTTAAMFIGQCLSPYILYAAEAGFHHQGYRFRFCFLAICLMIGAAGVVVTGCMMKRAERRR